MKGQISAMLLLLISSQAAHADDYISFEDVVNNPAVPAEYSPPQSEMDQRWRDYNHVPVADTAIQKERFGGQYFKENSLCVSANPYTGWCGCPSGYATQSIMNTNGEGGRNLFVCYR